MKIALMLIACMSLTATANAKKLCEGFAPKNNRWIGVGLVDDGISQSTFNKVLDHIVEIYNPIAAAHGYKLNFNRLWDDGTVNSDTGTEGDTWVINSYGGLARYPGMTADGYDAVACHELGHHLGGAPLFSDGSGMSVEGEADYHVGTKCLRKLWAGDDNVTLMANVKLDALLVARCSGTFADDAGQIALCERAGNAGLLLAQVLQQLGGSSQVAFNTPDKTVVDQTNEDHPEAQCRLDTYFASSVCGASSDVDFSSDDYKVGACMDGVGARPACWFKAN